MRKNDAIKTTGDLRSFLAETMTGVLNGDVDIDKARNITKMAGQINESIYAEVRAAKVRAEAGATIQELGAMMIGNQGRG